MDLNNLMQNTQKFTDEKYNILHQEWDEVHHFASPTYELRKRLILKILNKYIKEKKNATLLDVGCGTGDYSIKLAKLGFYVTAFDFSEYAIKKAVSNCKELGIENVNFQLDDITKFNTNKKFDVILISEVLEHIDNDLEIFKKYTNFINEEGFILCSVPFDPALWSQEDEHAGHIRRYDRNRINLLLEASNFQITDWFCYGFPFLRMMWFLRTRKKFFKRATNNIVKKQKDSFFIKFFIKFVVFFDSFFTKSKKGVGLIFCGKKRTSIIRN